ncbi:MAG: hypothetical protein V4526_02875 [Patescibacteria group bacterium]
MPPIPLNYKKYVLVFILTAAVFGLAFILSNYINTKKIDTLKLSGDTISIDILSLETQFALLQESPCKTVQNSTLSDELNSLGERLSYAENQRGFSTAEVLTLKKYYSILEIKDYLLNQKLRKTCGFRPTTILYFYSTKEECVDCTRQGYVLTKIREDNPDIRVYSFDYDLDVSAVQTMITLHKIPASLPVLVINDKVYDGFKSIEEMQAIVPELKASSTSATSTNATSSKATTTKK